MLTAVAHWKSVVTGHFCCLIISFAFFFLHRVSYKNDAIQVYLNAVHALITKNNNNNNKFNTLLMGGIGVCVWAKRINDSVFETCDDDMLQCVTISISFNHKVKRSNSSSSSSNNEKCQFICSITGDTIWLRKSILIVIFRWKALQILTKMLPTQKIHAFGICTWTWTKWESYSFFDNLNKWIRIFRATNDKQKSPPHNWIEMKQLKWQAI